MAPGRHGPVIRPGEILPMAETTRGDSVKIGGYRLPLPRSRALRIALGGVLLVLGLFGGWLPILGFWMAPLGLLILSVDIPRVRRWRRRFAVWFARRWPGLAAKLHMRTEGNGEGNGDGPARRP
jgi:hypothetical protein